MRGEGDGEREKYDEGMRKNEWLEREREEEGRNEREEGRERRDVK